MSFPHQSPYEDTKYDFNSGADWSLGSHHSSSPRILPQDGLRVEVTYEPHSPSMSFSNSPYLNSDQLPSSAPSTYPFMRKHDPWSNDLFHHGSASHSIQHGFDPELVKGMSGSAYLGPNSGISPAELGIETQFTNEPAFMDSALNSFSAGPTYSEPSPLMETTDYSPLPSRPHMNHYSSELTVNSAGSADMQRTESVWSNDSSYSRDCEDTTFRIDDISSATLDPSDIGELIDFPSKGPTSGRSYSTIKSGGIKKGRKRKLSAAERDSTAYMRKIGACYWCNKRKLKCDDGIPCRRCVKFHAGDLRKFPCRGEQLQTIAESILRANAFPGGDYNRFLCGTGERYFSSGRYKIGLDLGFGTALRCNVSIVQTAQQDPSSPFIHIHEEYTWPPMKEDADPTPRHDLVFPAILADTKHLAQDLNLYLSALLDNRESFQYFPLWLSEFRILRIIYAYYVCLPKVSRKPLEQALKLLILVHTGGDVGVRLDEDAIRIIKRYVPGYRETFKITPCFIRAQLGPVFADVAHELMKQVLIELEVVALSQEPSTFPMTVCTFSVLFMVMESLQYHISKLPYHCHNDNPSLLQQEDEPQTRNLEEADGSDILLRFYKGTTCHAKLGTLASESYEDIPQESQSSYFGDTSMVLSNLRAAARASQPYLIQRLNTKTVPRTDLSSYFDRLLAKMYLMEL